MKFIHKFFTAGYAITAGMFYICGVGFLCLAGYDIFSALWPGNELSSDQRFLTLLDCIGILTIAVAALELGQTVLEEEVQREASIAAPTRVRRFLSRFIVVVVVSLSIECLVSVFQFLHGSPELLPQAAAIGFAAAVLLAAWGAFIKLNIGAEYLEPQAMEEAKAEDDSVDK